MEHKIVQTYAYGTLLIAIFQCIEGVIWVSGGTITNEPLALALSIAEWLWIFISLISIVFFFLAKRSVALPLIYNLYVFVAIFSEIVWSITCSKYNIPHEKDRALPLSYSGTVGIIFSLYFLCASVKLINEDKVKEFNESAEKSEMDK